MSKYPHGSLPGEIDGTHVHVPKRAWHLLRKDPGFLKNWKSPKADRPYHIALSCLTRGLTEDQTVTVVRMWHQKHGHTFSEGYFREWTLVAAGYRATPSVYRYEANEYWKEIQRIAFDPNARQHSKLRVAYFLMNTEQATAREICEKTGISLKTVRNSLLALQDSGKVVMTEHGVYRALRSFHWDHATLVGTIENGYVWDDDHPAMYSWGQEINKGLEDIKTGDLLIQCYDYCRDKAVWVLYDGNQEFSKAFPHPDESEWVVDEDGEVVENSSGLKFVSLFPEVGPNDIRAHRNGDKFDFRKANVIVTGKRRWATVKDEDVDYFGQLAALCPCP
jgi:hypothetical protein